MAERINIQYSIDVEELPGEVSRILKGAMTELKDAQSTHLAKVADDEIMSLETIEQLEEVRLQLARIDFALSDVNNLVTSFLNYKTSPPAEVNAAPPDGMSPGMAPGMPTIDGMPADLEQLQQRIEDFKKQIASEDESGEISD
jgi:hypothetical protein